jgi:hypothetical protein
MVDPRGVEGVLDIQLERLETLLNNLMSYVDVHIARMGGS